MTQNAKYFYSCDYCGIKKEVEGTIKDKDKTEHDLLSDGWIFLDDFAFTLLAKGTKCSGSSGIDGEYCSLRCVLKAIEKSIKYRIKNK